MEITLIRDYQPEATKGRLLCDGKEIVKTFERPRFHGVEKFRRDNPSTKINESCCIPEGTYKVKWTYSNRFKKDTFEIMNVTGGWQGVRIHCANWVEELQGCIAPCITIQDMNPKNDPKIPASKKWMASQSKDALDKLLKFLGDTKEFTLVITSEETLCKV